MHVAAFSPVAAVAIQTLAAKATDGVYTDRVQGTPGVLIQTLVLVNTDTVHQLKTGAAVADALQACAIGTTADALTSIGIGLGSAAVNEALRVCRAGVMRREVGIHLSLRCRLRSTPKQAR